MNDVRTTYKNVSLDGINIDPDFNRKLLKVFEPKYVSKPAASPLERTQGSHTGTFDQKS